MFITLEGMEGAGKTTALGMLSAWLEQRGHNPFVTREPGGSRLGRRLRSMLLDSRQERISAIAETYLFFADRAQHLFEAVQPALEAGQIVLCDRYIDSTMAYQGYGRGMDPEMLWQAGQLAQDGLLPDLTIVLDLPVQVGLQRAGSRNHEAGTVISEGRFDAESRDFHERVRKGYLDLAAKYPQRITVINANRNIDQVIADCIAALQKLNL